jgi:methyl-CpG-binding domain protein 4
MQTPKQFSPYVLIQEELREHPWRLLVACMMLNQTSIVQVRQVIWKFFEKYPGPGAAVTANPAEMADLVKPLGLYNRRTKALMRMSQDFIDKAVDVDVSEFYGIGKYAADSYRIFVLGELPASVDAVDDKELKKYVEWAHGLE